MLSHAFSADVELMHAAMNHRRLGPAQIAASADSLGLDFTRARSCTLKYACLEIQAG